MANMVTRTVTGTQVVAKVVDKETNEITNYTTVLSGTFEDAKDASKKLAKVVPDNLVIIKIESMEKSEKLYGMKHEDFMRLAVELDPVTRKVIQ